MKFWSSVVLTGNPTDALASLLKVFPVAPGKDGRPAQKIIGSEVTVVRNPDTGNIITTYPTDSRRRKYGPRKDAD
ncbi:hypothetical protein [Olsenella phocaeensis]|uniref:hypothetical protein n=1 Tax=Olsenella phocaeensis TaxID=1852385 RepID=UPI00101ADD71|nr:hypothetical protein [Olsenella phocaeensis]